MALKMIEPTKHTKSGRYRIRLTIPKHLRASARILYKVGAEFTANLDTKDKREALDRAPAALAALKSKLKLVETLYLGNLRVLNQKEVWALAGEWYRQAAASNEDHADSVEGWERYRDDLFALRSFPEGSTEDWPDDYAPDFEPDSKALQEARTLLSQRGIVAHEASETALAYALWSVKLNFGALMIRRSGADYGPDRYDMTLPAVPASLSPSLPAAHESTDGITFEGLVRSWARDAGHNPDMTPPPRAYYDRHRTAARLATFLGHDDTAKVSKSDAVRFKESMQSAGKAASTVANDLSELSAIWKFGMTHGKVTSNPFAGILPPKKARNKKAKREPFTDTQAIKILTAARLETGALRWLPWVLAATGARLSEVCQSTKADIVGQDGMQFLRIHDDPEERSLGEAQRSVKNEGSIRMVPLHPTLVSEGFLAYVAKLPKGSALFPDIMPDKQFGQRGAAAVKLMGRWLRGRLKITDKAISPSHSWRHWWIDQARKAGLHPEIRNAITGHVDDGNESHRYGHGWKAMPQALTDAMGLIKLPELPRQDP